MYAQIMDISIEYDPVEEKENIEENLETESFNMTPVPSFHPEHFVYELNLNKNIKLKSFKIGEFSSFAVSASLLADGKVMRVVNFEF